MAIISQMARTYTLPPLPLRTDGLFADVIPTVNTTFDGADRLSFGGRVWGPSVEPLLTPAGFDCDTDPEYEDTTTIGYSDVLEPWTIQAGITCAAVPLDPGQTLEDIALDEVRKSLSASLAYAATSPLPAFNNLTDYDTVVGSGAHMGDTMEAIEAGLGGLIGNRRGYVLMSVAHLADAMYRHAVVSGADGFATPSGHLVVADAGIPTGRVFGVGRIGYSVSDPRLIDMNGSLDITRDTVTYLAEAEGLVLFDTATVVSSAVQFGS